MSLNKMLNIVLWMDCRAGGLMYFLKNKINFNAYKYEIHILGGFNEKKYLNEKNHNLPIDVLKNTDIFIYQFLDKQYLKYSTDPFNQKENVLSYLSDKCIKIGLHGVYMDCFWPITPDLKENTLQVFDSIKNMTNDEIISAFHNKELNFHLLERFNSNIEYTQLREKYWKEGFTDDNNHFIISSVDFIKNNYKENRLFFTHCHPTSYIFIDQTNQIINIINKYYNTNIELYKDIFSHSITFPNIPGGDWEDSTYIAKELGVKWINKPNDNYYLNLILNNKNFNKI